MMALRLLGLEFEPISLPELMHRLGESFKERSVRRWLHLLVEEGAVRKIGQKRGTKYIVAGRSEEAKNEISSCFSSASLKVIEFVKRPLL
jgi:predicted HTH transcriptional regulator